MKPRVCWHCTPHNIELINDDIDPPPKVIIDSPTQDCCNICGIASATDDFRRGDNLQGKYQVFLSKNKNEMWIFSPKIVIDTDENGKKYELREMNLSYHINGRRNFRDFKNIFTHSIFWQWPDPRDEMIGYGLCLRVPSDPPEWLKNTIFGPATFECPNCRKDYEPRESHQRFCTPECCIEYHDKVRKNKALKERVSRQNKEDAPRCVVCEGLLNARSDAETCGDQCRQRKCRANKKKN